MKGVIRAATTASHVIMHDPVLTTHTRRAAIAAATGVTGSNYSQPTAQQLGGGEGKRDPLADFFYAAGPAGAAGN